LNGLGWGALWRTYRTTFGSADATGGPTLMAKSRLGPQQTDLFDPALPLGFSYRDEVLSPAEDAVLRRAFEALPFKPFEFHGHLGNRRIVSFGWRYDYAGRALREAPAVPDFLHELREKAAAFAGLAAGSLRHALVTEYAPGAGIGWHRDKPMFADVVAFSFGAPCRLRFRCKHGETWKRAAQIVKPRSVYLLRGDARSVWYHSIPPVDALRYSVTFRNFAADRSPA
jgi:alkylated DNA repair dioxygenase AlkB